MVYITLQHAFWLTRIKLIFKNVFTFSLVFSTKVCEHLKSIWVELRRSINLDGEKKKLHLHYHLNLVCLLIKNIDNKPWLYEWEPQIFSYYITVLQRSQNSLYALHYNNDQVCYWNILFNVLIKMHLYYYFANLFL